MEFYKKSVLRNNVESMNTYDVDNQLGL